MKVHLSTIVCVSLVVLTFTSLCIAQPEAICVPWRPADQTIPHSTYSGAVHTLKGIARSGATQYYWDFGDGSPAMTWTAIGNPYNLGASHTYTGAVGQPFIATLHVRDALMNTDQDTYPIIIRESTDLSNPAHLDVRIDMAIDQGLWYLHTSMSRSTWGAPQPGYGQPYGYWPASSHNQAGAAAAVDAFQLHGSRVNGDYDGDPYVETVQRGLNFLLYYTYSMNISPQSAGNPDTNGNGIGLYCGGNNSYVAGICMVALASSGAPNRVAAVGSTNVYNRKYSDIVQDMVDYFAFGQVDPAYGVYRGGWRYSANYPNSDMSTTQWGPLGMLAAEQNMGSTVPAFVKTELPNFLNYARYSGLNNDNGAYGYTASTSIPNITKTAAGIICREFIGTSLTDSEVESPIGYLYRHWGDTGTSWDDQRWQGNSYVMYAIMKAMRIPEPDITEVTEYDYNTGTQTANTFDWYYTPTGQSQLGLASHIVATQQSSGRWDDNTGPNPVHNALSTGWRILILLKGVTIIPPTAEICGCGQNEYDLNEDIPLDGTCSTHPDPKRNIVLYEWDFDNDGVFDATGPTTTITGGFPSTAHWPVTLRVTDDNPANLGGPQTGTHTCQIFVHPPCLDPRADAGGPYLGFIGVPVTFDASGTTDPDSTTLTYQWDLDNDGQFDDATGVSPQYTWSAPFTGVIGLRVTDGPCTADPTHWDGEDFAYTTVDIGNHDPISDPDGPYSAPPSGTITLDGSGSHDIDPGDSIVSYAWDLDNDGMFDDSTDVKPSFTVGATPGTVYPIGLKVTDSFGETDIEYTTVTVIDTIQINIDIYPNRVPNRVFLSRNYTLYVAALGSTTFDVTSLNSSTVRFGKTGTEAAPGRAPIIRDLNGDGLLDAMYGFMTGDCGFALGDTVGWLKGKTNAGTNVEGSDSVLVSP